MTPFRPVPFPRWPEAGDLIRVEEYQQDGTLVIRADLPGTDPDNDAELTVSDGMLHIEAERREEENKQEKGYVRRELRYGSLSRSLPLPAGVTEADITATHKAGILEIRVPGAEARNGQQDSDQRVLTARAGPGVPPATELASRRLPPERLISELASEPPARALPDRATQAEMLILGTTRPDHQPGQPPPAMGPVARTCLRLAHCPVVVMVHRVRCCSKRDW